MKEAETIKDAFIKDALNEDALKNESDTRCMSRMGQAASKVTFLAGKAGRATQLHSKPELTFEQKDRQKNTHYIKNAFKDQRTLIEKRIENALMEKHTKRHT